MPDISVPVNQLNDASWSTKQNLFSLTDNTPTGLGSLDTREYHDVFKFIRCPRSANLSLTINSVSDVVATAEFSNKYLAITPNSPGGGSVNLTVSDQDFNSMTFDYLVTTSS